MEIRFSFQHEQIALRLNNFPVLFIGSQVEGRIASAMGWTGKTKGLSQRFMVLLALLAVARKLPTEVQQHLSIYSDDNGYIRLQDLRRFTSFSSTASCDITKRDICNHFYIASGDRSSLVTIQSGSRGSHGNDLIRLTCAPEEIHFESAKQICAWLASLSIDLGIISIVEKNVDSGAAGMRLDWQAHVDSGSTGFSPRRPINHPSHFFGRNHEIRLLFSWMSRLPLQNPAILGSRISGKTSLLRQFCHINTGASLRTDQQASITFALPRLSIIYTDFEVPRMQHLPGLQNHILSGLGIVAPEHCPLDHFIDLLSCKIQAPTVIIMDNIGAVMRENSSKKDTFALSDIFWDSMRALVSNYTNGQLAFIVSAREETETLASRYHYSSSFFNIFRPLKLGPLSDDAAASVVDSSPIPFIESDKAWIIESSGKWPGLLQIACDHCLDAVRYSIPALVWRETARREMETAAATRYGRADV